MDAHKAADVNVARIDEPQFTEHLQVRINDDAFGIDQNTIAIEDDGVDIHLTPPEQALDIGEFELDIGGAAMIALAGIRRCFHLAEQCVHLI